MTKRKEAKEAEIKKLEQEKVQLERTLKDKEENYEKTKGTKYLKRDDFK